MVAVCLINSHQFSYYSDWQLNKAKSSTIKITLYSIRYFRIPTGGSGASGDGDIISSTQELRVHKPGFKKHWGQEGAEEEFTLPGHVVMSGTREPGGRLYQKSYQS